MRLASWLSHATGRTFAREPAAEVAGGSINRCLRWDTKTGPAFVKVAPKADLGTFEAEAAGLRELQDAQAVRVPRVLAVGAAEDAAVLALEWIDFGTVVATCEARLGRSLARLHRVTAPRFGWRRDNTIGRTPQPNAWDDDWARFLAERRLGFKLRLAAKNGLDSRAVERGLLLAERCGGFFASYRPQPSLLHGDLWGGNWGAAEPDGEPVIFDPAVYFGDREADLAMTRLFGGFGQAFYSAYQSEWPLDAGAAVRVPLYNLYHVLNHYNLFGGGYGTQAASMIERLLADL
jgi:fructosamine-3-kinase